MLRHVYQSGIVTVFNSASSQALQLWRVARGASGYVALEEEEEEIGGPVLCLRSANLAETFIMCPADAAETLGVKLPFLAMSIKNTGHLLSIEVEILDDRGAIRRLRAANYESEAHIDSSIARMPLRLDDGWNYMTLDLRQMTAMAYGTSLCEVRRVVIHASACVRLVFFADRVVPEDELPRELRLYRKRDGGP
ncbi:Cilia- and flagella-associated protein 20 [Coemansia biformis]|uniref:Cilia- and flagella-associated protein 20 n=1 Tax=Coemansia biformis TaxID=1286918 RepID=A0A9W7Y8E8_9FUNG|nr:Cilia- and flagella-associated protein 20 [Coemansia biformis]